MVFYKASNADGQQSMTVFGNGWEKPVAGTHPNFTAILTYLVSTPVEQHDDEHVRGLVDPSVGIGRMLQAEFGDRVTFDLHHFYIDGIPETGRLAQHVKQVVMSGEADWQRLVRFLVRLDANPSKKAKNAVWDWVEKHGATITEDGRIMGFKGLKRGQDVVTGEYNVPISSHSGPNNFINGEIYGEAGTAYHVPHRVGTVISKRRSDVDDNTKLACSTGLHVGSYSYAKTFGENREDAYRYSTMGKVASTFALVAFAPEDVVSVPEDGTSDWKIRVSKYEVVEFLDKVEDVLKDKPVYDVQTPAPNLPPGQVFEGEPTVEPVEPPVLFEEEPVDEDVDNGVEYDAEDDDLDAAVEAAETLSQDALVEAADEAVALQEEDEDQPLVEPTKGTGLLGRLTLQDWADVNPGLARDLADTSQGHKALGRKYEAITSEASVRRYRKSHGL